MKDSFRISFAFILLCVAASVGAAEPAPAVSVKDNMRSLRQDYMDLEALLDAKPIDFGALQKAVEDMEKEALQVQGLAGSGHMGKAFSGLLKDIRSLKAEARRRRAAGAEEALNGLYENCFRCHLTHSSPRPKGKTS